MQASPLPRGLSEGVRGVASRQVEREAVLPTCAGRREKEETMSETGFVCPNCGNTEHFTAFAIVLYGSVDIDPYGWNWYDSGFDAELLPGAIMRCEECEYEGVHTEFEEEA